MVEIGEGTRLGTVTISVKEYQELLEDQRLLDALRGAGVDNWEGWDDAIDNLNEE